MPSRGERLDNPLIALVFPVILQDDSCLILLSVNIGVSLCQARVKGESRGPIGQGLRGSECRMAIASAERGLESICWRDAWCSKGYDAAVYTGV